MAAIDFLNEVLKDLPACNKFTDKSKLNVQYGGLHCGATLVSIAAMYLIGVLLFL
jgi:hypothetical protein